jgi:1-aminocyclopropane-1-carboxylate deaminase/D-cysteine desulfhydrase-like pyridoxal-dependent ACC family enzyme
VIRIVFCEHTPIDTHTIRGRTVFVKRDDLFALPPAPPLAKLRGLRVLLSRARRNGYTLIGCFEASASRIGHGLAAACTQFPDLNCIVAYPRICNRPVPQSSLAAESLGARLFPVASNIVAICYRIAARHIEAEGGYMLPFGFECLEAVTAIEDEARTIPLELIIGGTLVVACGSGVTLSGVLRGLPTRPARVIGVSVGRSVDNILSCLGRCGVGSRDGLEIRPPTRRLREISRIGCPFPCDPHYDLKAWELIEREIEMFSNPVLFWNVGG